MNPHTLDRIQKPKYEKRILRTGNGKQGSTCGSGASVHEQLKKKQMAATNQPGRMTGVGLGLWNTEKEKRKTLKLAEWANGNCSG